MNEGQRHLIASRDWIGDDESHACNRFLTGWISLNNEEYDDALVKFRLVIDRYPKSSFSKKAKDFVNTLEGGE